MEFFDYGYAGLLIAYYTTVKIGNRLYKVKLHFSDRAKESFEDKVLRMAKTDAEKLPTQTV